MSDDDAYSMGLTCGGIIDVYVESISRHTFPEFGDLAGAVRAGRPVALSTVVAHSDQRLVGRHLLVSPRGATVGSFAFGKSRRCCAGRRSRPAGTRGEPSHQLRLRRARAWRRDEHFHAVLRAEASDDRLRAIDFAAALVRVGAFLGHEVTVCDARSVSATPARFPDADRVMVDWPHRYLAAEQDAGRTVIDVLTHDPKFDVPVLEVALRLPEVAYVGAMGSRRTHHDRMKRLAEAGLTEGELQRLCSPIGLDLGARTPEETALSIAAEITALRLGGSGHPLGRLEGPIHDSAATTA